MTKKEILFMFWLCWLIYGGGTLLVLTGSAVGYPTLPGTTGVICWVVWVLVAMGIPVMLSKNNNGASCG